MKPDPIYIRPGSFSLAGTPVERNVQDLDRHIERLQELLGDELKITLSHINEALQNEPSALICFTGAFTGLSTLLTFCSFTRGIIALEKGMETLADQSLVAKLRGMLVPIITSQCEILGESMVPHLGVRSESLVKWYRHALAEVHAIAAFIGRLA
jgi:hypothetical protein